MRRRPIPPKTCRGCATVFRARPIEPPSAFAKRKFCSKRCAATFYAAERIAQMNAGRVVALADPERMEQWRQATRRALDMVRPRANAAKSRKAIDWCPPEYREAYRHLLYGKRMGIARSRAIIREQIAADARREVNRITAEMRAKQARERMEAY